MHLRMGSKPDRKARTGPLLLGLAVAAISLSLAGETLAVDRQAFERWKIVPRMLRDVSVRDSDVVRDAYLFEARGRAGRNRIGNFLSHSRQW